MHYVIRLTYLFIMLYHCVCQFLGVNLLSHLILTCIQVNDVTGIRLNAHCINDALENIGLSSPLVKCKYLNCKNCDHIDATDSMCDTVVKCCIDSGLVFLTQITMLERCLVVMTKLNTLKISLFSSTEFGRSQGVRILDTYSQ